MSNSQLNSDWNIQTLATRLNITFAQNTKVYAIIEPSLMPDWQQTLYQYINEHKLSSPYVENLFHGTHYQHLEYSPVLVELTEYAELQLLLFRQFESLPAGCLFVTPASIKSSDLLATLRNRLTVYKENTATFFRYYDPRMLLPFLAALTLDEKHQFLPQVNGVYWHHQQWLHAQWTMSLHSTLPLSDWKMPAHLIEKMIQIQMQEPMA